MLLALPARALLVIALALAAGCQSATSSDAPAQANVPLSSSAAVANTRSEIGSSKARPAGSVSSVTHPGLIIEPAVIGDARDIAARDTLRHPEQVVAALGLSPGQRVADIGAGFGYFTFRLAAAVGPKGRVVATDIDSAMLAKLRAHEPMPENIVVREVTPSDPGLGAGAYDLVFLSEVDHYFPDRVAYLKKLRAALAPKGEIAVTKRFALQPPLMAAAKEAGYTVAREVTDLPHHYLVFLKPIPR